MKWDINPPIEMISFPRRCKQGVTDSECEKRCGCIPTIGYDEIVGLSKEDDEWCKENCCCEKVVYYTIVPDHW